MEEKAPVFYPFSERFRDFALERNFRSASFESDKKQLRILLFFSVAFLGAAVINNVIDQDIYSSNIIVPRILITIEALALIGSVVIILLMEKIEDFVIFDITFFVLLIIHTVLTLYDNIIRPADYIGAFYICNYIIYYVFVPISTRYQAPPALLLSAGMIITLLLLKNPNYPAQVTYSLLALVFLNISCHIMSVKLGRSNRSSYLALQEGKQGTRRMKKLAKEIKTLSDVFPLCSACLKIRDEKGHWLDPETYVSVYPKRALDTGTCPECNRSHRQLSDSNH